MPSLDPSPPPPLPILEADSQFFALAPSVPRGFKLQTFRPTFGGDHRGPWEEGGPSQTPLPFRPPSPSNTSLRTRHEGSSATACLLWYSALQVKRLQQLILKKNRHLSTARAREEMLTLRYRGVISRLKLELGEREITMGRVRDELKDAFMGAGFSEMMDGDVGHIQVMNGEEVCVCVCVYVCATTFPGALVRQAEPKTSEGWPGAPKEYPSWGALCARVAP